MKKFPVTIVDDFYENPDLIRNFALSLPYFKTTDGRWPGSRTELLHNINSNFFETFNRKLFSLFYDLKTTQLEWEVETTFQLIDSFSSDKDNIKNDGWIHWDKECCFSGVIYLNPNPKPNWGTSVYKLKPNEVYDDTHRTKFLHYSKSDKFNEQEYEIEKKCNNNKFIETVRVENVYNRLILFESGVFHGVPSFYSDDESRLTQVFFVKYLSSSDLYPILRSRVSYD